MADSTPLPFFLDCDTGIDDSLALVYLLADPGVDLVGVSTVSGNVDATTAARNTLDLLALAGRDEVPVAVGESDPLIGRYTGAVPHIHGANGVGDIDLPRAGTVPSDLTGPELLIRAARQRPGRLRLIAVGPLTNLARALSLDNELPQLVHSVTLMGGAVHVPGNVTATAEANIWNDPEAAAAVFAAAWPVTLVPLDVTMRHTLTEADRGHLLASDQPLVVALGEMLDLYFEFYASHYGDRLCVLHDPLAAVIGTNAIDSIGDLVGGSLRVVLDGDERGRTIYLPEPATAPHRVVVATEQAVAPHLMQRILAGRVSAITPA